MKRVMLSLLMLGLAASLSAQTYGARVTDAWADIKPPQWGCTSNIYADSRLYEPSVYPLHYPNSSTPNGELGMMSQGACPLCAAGNYGDALLYNKRSTLGAWSSASDAVVKRLVANYPGTPSPGQTSCTERIDLSSPRGAFGSPAVVPLYDPTRGRTRYYMAYLIGNADWWYGSIGWAVSDDGQTWNTYNDTDGHPKPIFRSKNHMNVQTGTCAAGFAAVSMTTRVIGADTYFYVYGTFMHRKLETGNWWQGGTDTQTGVTFRFRYNPGHTYGFPLPGETYMLYNGQWQATNGQLEWTTECQGCPGLDLYLARSSWSSDDHLFTNSVTPINHPTWKYLMLMRGFNESNDWMVYRLSADAENWTQFYYIDMSSIKNDPDVPAPYLGGAKRFDHPQVWYGTLNNVTGLWGFITYMNRCGNSDYHGSTIIPTKIEFCSQTQPCQP